MIAPRNIVVATDFGDAAARALAYGLEFAQAFGARPLVTTEGVQTLDVRPVLLRGHQPGRAVIEFASQIEADLIIIGTHGRGGLAEFFLGSCARKVVRSAPCPVLTIRAAERDFVRSDPDAAMASTRLH